MVSDVLAPNSRVHVVAIGGAAMSAIARYLFQLGHTISGSDVRETATTESLRTMGIAVAIGHSAANLAPGTDVVIYSTAVAEDNPELVEARRRALPVLHRSEIMATIVATKSKCAVVSGTHGKTTTSSLLTEILRSCGAAPSFFIGGTASGLGTNAHYDPAGEWIVVEGDESDRSFLAFGRDAALVTNIEADHLEHWDNSFDVLVGGFERFVDECRGPVGVCADDAIAAQLARPRPTVFTYGFAATAHYRLLEYTPTATGSHLVVAGPDGEMHAVTIALRGRDMATNALGAAALANRMGVPWSDAVAALASFRGVARRFQHRATYNGADLYDDYAHTATEIATTLARAREGAWERVIAVCQPHRYTRIAAHGHEYGAALRSADVVVVTALDPAFEPVIADVDATIVVDSVRRAAPQAQIEYLPEWSDLRDLPWRVGRPGDIIVTLGCGTITDAHTLWADEAKVRGE